MRHLILAAVMSCLLPTAAMAQIPGAKRNMDVSVFVAGADSTDFEARLGREFGVAIDKIFDSQQGIRIEVSRRAWLIPDTVAFVKVGTQQRYSQERYIVARMIRSRPSDSRFSGVGAAGFGLYRSHWKNEASIRPGISAYAAGRTRITDLIVVEAGICLEIVADFGSPTLQGGFFFPSIGSLRLGSTIRF